MASLNSILNNQDDEENQQQTSNQSGVTQNATSQQSQPAQQSQQSNTQPVQPVTSANQQQNQQPQQPQQTQSQQSGTSQQAKQPTIATGFKQVGATASQPQVQQNKTAATKQTGTGYTNLNRIMEANVGNKLGQAVSGGISSNIQNLQSGVKSAQDRFQEEAEKNRLDTEANEAKRQEVLDRFDESKVNVDESQFQLDQALQDEYNQKQAALQSELDSSSAKNQGNLKTVQDQVDFNTESLRILRKLQQGREEGKKKGQIDAYKLYDLTPEERDFFMKNIAWSRGMNINKHGQFTNSGSGGFMNIKLKTLTNALNSLNNVKNIQQSITDSQLADLTGRLESLGVDFQNLSDTEKQKWIQSEKDRLVAENMPDQDEMEAFRKYITGAYSGPKELENYQSLLGQAQQTQDLGTLARLQGGRQELLKQFVGGKDYTAGQRNLDEAILGQSSDNSLLSKIAKQALGSEKSVQEANKLASSQAQDLTNRAKQFGQQTVKSIEETRAPISQRIDAQRQNLINQETNRQQNFTKLQDILTGKDESTKQYDPKARLGLALQMAQDSGYLSQGDINDLVAKGGLIDRAQKLGLDPNQLIMERLQGTGAIGIDRMAAATSDQEKRISALDRLLGRTGTDVEFGTGQEQYQAGKIGLDTKNLIDYISKTEQERMQSSPQYAEQMKAAGLTPLQQILGGYASQIGGITNLDPSQNLEGMVNTAGGYLNLASDTQTKALQGLNNMLGGNSGINKLISGYDKLKGSTLDYAQNNALNTVGALDDLKSGKLDQVIAKLSGFDAIKDVGGNVINEISRGVGNVGKAISTALSGGSTGNWHPSKFGTIDVETGQGRSIGSFQNESSDKILNQIIQGQIQRVNETGNNQGSTQGSKMMNELLKYYMEALKREGKA